MSDVENWTATVTYESELCYWIEYIVGGPENITSLHILNLVRNYYEASYPYPTSEDIMGCVYYYRGDIPTGNTWTGCDF